MATSPVNPLPKEADSQAARKALEPLMGEQVGGSHYDFPIQPVDFIVRNGLDFLTGNVVKYVVRHKRKGGLQDLLKARQYLDALIRLAEEEGR